MCEDLRRINGGRFYYELYRRDSIYNLIFSEDEFLFLNEVPPVWHIHLHPSYVQRDEIVSISKDLKILGNHYKRQSSVGILPTETCESYDPFKNYWQQFSNSPDSTLSNEWHKDTEGLVTSHDFINLCVNDRWLNSNNIDFLYYWCKFYEPSDKTYWWSNDVMSTLVNDYSGNSIQNNKIERICRRRRTDCARFINADKIFFPFYNGTHWCVYVVCNLKRVVGKQNYCDSSKVSPVIIKIDPHNLDGYNIPPTDMVCNTIRYICQCFLNIHNPRRYIQVHLHNLPGIATVGTKKDFDVFHGSTYVGINIIFIYRHLDVNKITNSCLKKDPFLYKLFNSLLCFVNKKQEIMDNLRTEMRIFYLRLLLIWMKKEHRNRILKDYKVNLKYNFESRKRAISRGRKNYVEYLTKHDSPSSIEDNSSSHMCNCSPCRDETATVQEDSKRSSDDDTTYVYGSKHWGHFTDLKYLCLRDDGGLCCIQSIASIQMEQRIMNAIDCGYELITTPFILDSGYVAIQTSLDGDSEYFDLMDHYQETMKYSTSMLCPNFMRLVTSQIMDDVSVYELCLHHHFALQDVHYSKGLQEGTLQFNDMYHYLFHHFINVSMKATKDQHVLIMRKLMSLSPDIVGSSVGIPVNNAILFIIERFFLIRIIVIDYDVNSYVSKEDPIYHVGGLELSQLFSEEVEYYPLRVVLLHKRDGQYHLMKSRVTGDYSFFPTSLNGLLLSLLNISNVDMSRIYNSNKTLTLFSNSRNKSFISSQIQPFVSHWLSDIEFLSTYTPFNSNLDYTYVPSTLAIHCLEHPKPNDLPPKFSPYCNDERFHVIHNSTSLLLNDYLLNMSRDSFLDSRFNEYMNDIPVYYFLSTEWYPTKYVQPIIFSNADHVENKLQIASNDKLRSLKEILVQKPSPSNQTANQNMTSNDIALEFPRRICKRKNDDISSCKIKLVKPVYNHKHIVFIAEKKLMEFDFPVVSLVDGLNMVGDNVCGIYDSSDYGIDMNHFMFNIKNSTRSVTKFFNNENYNNIQLRGNKMHTFGSTCYACRSPRCCSIHDTSSYSMIPRLTKNCKNKDQQGYQLLHDPKFKDFALIMERILIDFIGQYKKQDHEKGSSYGEYVDLAKKIIPEELRIGGTCFTQFSILGDDSSGKTAPHTDGNDIYQAFMVLKQDETSGGDLLMYNTDKNKPVQYKRKINNGHVVVGEFNHLVHETEAYVGPRFTANFYSNIQVFNHFAYHGKYIYFSWKYNGFPKMQRNRKVVIVYDQENEYAELRYQVKNVFVEHHIDQKEKGEALGYVDLPGDKCSSSLNHRCCVQDAVINAGLRLGVKINKRKLYRECPPKVYYNTQASEVLWCQAVMHYLMFSRIDFDGLKGGLEYLLLQYINKGVFLCFCTVESGDEFESFQEKHAFVYDSNYVDKRAWGCIGAIIDNRTNSPFRLIDSDDRADVSSARYVFSDFFEGETRITKVFLVEENKSY